MSPPLPAAAAQRPGFVSGMRSLAGGFGYLFRTPRLIPYAIVPAVIALVLSSVLAVAAVGMVPAWIESLFGTPDGTFGTVLVAVAKVAGTLLAVFAAVTIGFGLAQPLSGSALERIVRQAEADAGGAAWPPTTFFSDLVRSLQTTLVGYVFSVPILAMLFVVDLVFAPAVVVTFPLKLLVMTTMLAWDICDYPLSIRGVAVATRVAFMKRNIAAMLGFGIAVTLLSMLLPCVLLVVLPAGVAGAARMIVQIERFEAESQRLLAAGRS